MKTVHLVGVCGTAMATLAALLKRKGFSVRGSDQDVYPPMSEFLVREGIELLEGFRDEHITDDLDIVVIGNAVSRGNPEVEAVLDRKIPYRSLPEMLREEFLWGARSIVVTGTHGKTTTTSLVAWSLTAGGLDPSFMIGGIAGNFGSSGHLGRGKVFVIEGDEYDSAFFDKTAKFLKYLPDIAIINNVEFDHADIYPDLESIRVAFRRFVNLVPRSGLLLLGADDAEAMALKSRARCRVETFGLSAGADWRAAEVRTEAGATTFEVLRRDERIAAVTLPLLGTFNVRNALAAMAASVAAGMRPERVADGLRRFQGVRRRLEVRGVVRGVTVFDDFAHHPTAVRETLQAVRAARPGRRVWAVFEPRSASSCRRVFQKDFVGALRSADAVVIGAVYRSTLPEDERLSEPLLVDDLNAAGTPARHCADVAQIVRVLADQVRPGDLVVIMSNGDFGGLHQRLLAALAAGRGAEAPAPESTSA